ncbi:MAG: VanZ family protein [Candidatus Accumulibacter delftensis]
MSHLASPTRPAGSPDDRSGRLVLAWLGYIGLVVYGSLVPMNFHPLPLDQAWAAFQQLPMLKIGAQGRADWVSNGVLYIPVGFLTVALFPRGRTRLAQLPLLVGAALFCAALALAVEFTQLFFPARTVSRNDVIAECIGSALGIMAACYWSAGFLNMLSALAGKLGQLSTRVLQFYAIGYFAFSLFPFDFLLSTTELAAKIDSSSWGWFLSQQTMDRGAIIFTAKLLAEVLAVIPLGLMLGNFNAARQQPATRHALLYGTLLGLLIEVAQFLIFSGVSQGASLLTRAVGMYGGARLWRDQGRCLELQRQAAKTRLTLPLAALYLLALVAVNSWFDRPWHGLDRASSVLTETHWLPFYYHYYTTEQAALLSLASVALMYAPIGVLAWLRRWSPAAALWCAAVVASGIETSKLFLTGLHPDPTNILIAAVATWSASWLLRRLQAAPTRNAATDFPGDARASASTAQPEAPPTAPATVANDGRPPARAWFALTVTVLLAAWIVIDFPYHPLLLALALLAYAAALWRNPRLLWAAVPAAIPLLDLAPWSGRFYLDEFDFLIIVSLVVAYARVPPAPRNQYRDVVGFAVACLIAGVFAIGTLRGMLPLTLPDANSFSNYHSPYNALRVAKGAFWALLLWALMPRFAAGGVDIRMPFARGMVLGLAGTVAVVIWERLLFPGLFNFTDHYRVTGPFSLMHTGGAAIETYLTAALPFAVLLTVQSRALAARLGGGLLLLASGYALAVTFARAGYAGFSVALIIICLAAFLPRRPRTSRTAASDSSAPAAQLQPASDLRLGSPRIYRWAAPLLLIAVLAAVAAPIYSGSFARERLASSGSDLAVRQAHWADALAMRDPGLLTALFGVGIGRYPETHYWRSSEDKATSYRLESEGDNRFLRLGTGQPLYMEQFVRIEPGQEYLLRLDTRSAQAGGQLSVSLCEKLLLTSRRCVSVTTPAQGGNWQQHELRLNSGEVGGNAWMAMSPVKLSLHNAAGIRVDVDNVRLLQPDGESLIANGDFEQGLDLWFFAVDVHWPWDIASMPVGILFDLGWLGLLAFAVLLALAIKRTGSRAWRGDLLAAATLAALAGVLIIGTLGAVIDTPRFLLLFLLLTWLEWGGERSPRRNGVLLKPVPELKQLAGIAKGARTAAYRDRQDSD